MRSDWSIEEDQQPGKRLIRAQPELTPKGYQWTWLVEVNWPAAGRVQVYIRDCSDQFVIDHGRVFPLQSSDEDGA